MTGADSPHLAVAAYALHALPPAEEAAFEEHLAHCAPCRDELARLRHAAAELGSAEPRQPPPELRARILATAAHTPQGDPTGPPPGTRTRRVLALALAASIAVAAAMGGVAVWQHNDAQDAARMQQHDRQQSAEFAAVLTAPDAALFTGRLTGGASVSVVVSREQGKAAFTADRLPAPPKGKAYELWYAQPSGALRPAGTLPPTGSRAAQVLAGPVGAAVAVGVTLEPAAGSPQPTSKALGIISLGA
ncbi:anti-sigma factor domain-containing protein [Streptomyces sp. NPDC101225]|uniref:anti-sigma factor n=1 Tax=Streptomyces sp. NPDC101225 TaxID=3366135 RepID=UPI0037FC594F